MGGWGSGRTSSKNTTEDMLTLDVRQLQRDGILKSGLIHTMTWSLNGQSAGAIQMHADGARLRLIYQTQQTGGEPQLMDYSVKLAWSNGTFGGKRVWFQCPTQGCAQRVAILYGGPAFACRHCHKLAYESQRECFANIHRLRMDRVRKKLGWEQGTFTCNHPKPKGMHWKTFNRLKAEDHQHSTAWFMAVEVIHDLLDERLAAIERAYTTKY